MAVIKDFKPNKVYISPRLRNRLRTILTYPLTIVETPTGYGKTTVIKSYLDENQVKYIWFNIDTTDKDEIFKSFCLRIDSVNEDCSKKLKSIGFPKDVEAAKNISKAILEMEFNEKMILVLDNYHLISDDMLNLVIQDLSTSHNKNFKVVGLTQSVNSKNTFDMIIKKKLNYISKGGFELTKDEIKGYYESCGIDLDEEEVEFLYQYTEGWVSALYLQMLCYVTTNNFEPTVSIDNLICKSIWNNLNRKQQDYLITISIFPNFSFGQSMEVAIDVLPEDEMEDLLDNNSFIKFDIKSRKYYVHTILKTFLEMEFNKLEPVFKKRIYTKAGHWYCINEMYFKAIKYFEHVGDYEGILAMDYYSSDLIPYMNYKNQNIFINVVINTPDDVKIKYCDKYTLFVFSLFIYNEKDLFNKHCDLCVELIEKSALTKGQKKYLNGELALVRTLQHFNNLWDMEKSYEEAFELLNSPSKLFDKMNTIIFNNPSILSTFHTKCGKINEELVQIEKIMPLFYKLFDGASKGGDALFKAEVLFNQGEFADATILCEKAMYLADTRNQIDVKICALFLMTRIAYINADFVLINTNLDKLRNEVESSSRYDLSTMCDMCESYIKVLLEAPELISSWLTDHNMIEQKCRIHNLGFANLIYSKYLIANGKYDEFIAVSGSFLSTANCFNNVIYKIYTYIFIAIANASKNNNAKAKNMLLEAVKLSYEDNLIVPFVESFSEINSLLNSFNEDKYKNFIELIIATSKKYSKGLRVLKKASKNDDSYGLTNRELEVSKLAAKRLTNKEIADMLFIAESTVKSNLKGIFNKLGINSRSELKNFFQ